MFYRLTIKGTPNEVRQAMTEHGMDAHSWNFTADLGTEQVVLLLDWSRNVVDALNQWFGEPVRSMTFPPGTLLFWAPDIP